MKINLILVIFYFSISYIPALGSLDRSPTQWLILGILNLISFLKLSFDNYNFKNNLSEIIKSKIVKSYSLFITICLISIFYSINQVESLVVFIRFLTQFISFVLILILFESIKLEFKTFTIILASGALLESFALNYTFISNYQIGVEYGRSAINKGLSSNINIAAFSLVMKIPFVVHFITYFFKKFKLLIIGVTILSSIFFSIYLTGSRGAVLAVYFQLLLVIILHFFVKGENKKFHEKFTKIFLSGLITSLIINNFLFDTLRVSYRTQQIIERGSESRIEYYNQALQSIFDKPILGNGIGTWKIISNYYDRFTMEGYTVQYNVHNDFLQIFTEIGVIGFISYVLIFVFFILKLLKKINNTITIPVVIFISSYLIDANLNFPIERPMIQIMLLFTIAYSIHKFKRDAFEL